MKPADLIINNNSSPKQLLEWCDEISNSQASQEWVLDVTEFIKDWFDDNEYILTSTSGTTGQSKKLKLLKSSMKASAKLTNSFFNITNETNTVLCLPANYIGGKMMIVRALISGAKIVLVEPSSSPLNAIDTSEIDFCAMVPLQVQNSLSQFPNKFKKIKNTIIGGAPLSSELEKELSRLNQGLFATFGMTETISHIALRQLSGENKSQCFKALSGVKFDLSKNDCLIVHASHISSQPIITNDMVELKDNDKFIWKGRIDNIINSGGIKINPEEIEFMLADILHQKNYFIGSKKDEKLGQALILVIEAKKNEFDISDLNKNLNRILPKFKSPKEILFISKFIKTHTGKIKRKDNLQLLGYF